MNYFCKICNGNLIKRLFTKNGIDILECLCCGLSYSNCNSPEYKETYFKASNTKLGYLNYQAEKKAIHKTSQDRLIKILDMTVGEKLLDIGCAYGFFLEKAQEYFDVTGIDVSEMAVNYASRNGLLVANCEILSAGFNKDSFDVVTMWDTIEHLERPREVLEETRRIMKGGGLLVLSTGDCDSPLARLMGKHWRLYNPPQHLSFFSKDTITRLLKLTGFEVEKIEYNGQYFSLRYFGIPSSKIVYLNTHDIMTVYAR